MDHGPDHDHTVMPLDGAEVSPDGRRHGSPLTDGCGRVRSPAWILAPSRGIVGDDAYTRTREEMMILYRVTVQPLRISRFSPQGRVTLVLDAKGVMMVVESNLFRIIEFIELKGDTTK